MARARRALRGGALTRDGLFELLAGLGLAGAGYLLLPVTLPRADLASWAFLPAVAAALLLPACKALLRRLLPSATHGAPAGAAGWGWLLTTLLALALGSAALVLVWLEVDSPLFGAAVRIMLAALSHVTAILGLLVGLAFILIGYVQAQWRVALEGMLWAVVGLVLDMLLWGGVLPPWYMALVTPRNAAAFYLLALGGLTALLGLVALIRFVALRPHSESSTAA